MNHTPVLPPSIEVSAESEIRDMHQRSGAGSMPAYPPFRLRRPITRRMSTLITAFGYAFSGLWYFLSTQRNAQIHCLVAACAVALGLFLPLQRWEWLALVLIMTLVLAAEGVNTAIEAAVDVATSTYHPLAGVAKDVAAGTVLLCAMASVLVGCIIFLPHLWQGALNLWHTLLIR